MISAVGATGVPVKLGDTKSAFKAKAATEALLNGFKASEVLSAFDKPTSDFKIPVGVVIAGLSNDLLVKVSVPAKVAKVPETGKVTTVLSVAVKVVLNAPEVTKLPPNVMVLFVLAIPVPPFAPRTIPVTFEAVPEETELATKSLTALLLGYLSSASFWAVKLVVVVKLALDCLAAKASVKPTMSVIPASVPAVTRPFSSYVILVLVAATMAVLLATPPNPPRVGAAWETQVVPLDVKIFPFEPGATD